MFTSFYIEVGLELKASFLGCISHLTEFRSLLRHEQYKRCIYLMCFRPTSYQNSFFGAFSSALCNCRRKSSTFSAHSLETTE